MNSKVIVYLVAFVLFVVYSLSVFTLGNKASVGMVADRVTDTAMPSVTPTQMLVGDPTPTPTVSATRALTVTIAPTSESIYVYKEKKVYTTVVVTPTPTPTIAPYVVYWKIIRRAESPIVGDICRYPASAEEQGDLTLRMFNSDYPNVNYPNYRLSQSDLRLIYFEALEAEIIMQCYDARYLNTTFQGQMSFKRGMGTSSDVFEFDGGYTGTVESGEREGLDENWTDWIIWLVFNS